jgi:hypothetical protein
MYTGEKKCKELNLRGYLLYLAIFIPVSAFLLYDILKPVILLQIYEQPFFYLSILAIICWLGIGLAIISKLRGKGKVLIAQIVGIMTWLTGAFGTWVLDAILGYKIVLALSYWLIPALGLILYFVFKIVKKVTKYIRRGYER